MTQQVTCPHCSRALFTPTSRTAGFFICPRCRGEMPNPAVSDGSGAPGEKRVLAIDAEIAPDRPRLRWGSILLAMLFIVVMSFFVALAVGLLIRLTGKHGWSDLIYLLYVWLGVGGLGAFAILLYVTSSLCWFLWPRLPEWGDTSRADCFAYRGLTIFASLLVGVVAGAAILGVTFYTVYFGGLLGVG
jgi:hypothetical protein